ncbi:MAG: CerR family C-terminal domain-containing protein [Syntrophales bacterium]|nr:CerR family C-terminal domain-containing protein [Syntrophales bacterium]
MAAIKIFAKKGFKEASVREICQLAGSANLNSINYYFGGKEKLYKAILDLMFAELKRREAADNTPNAEKIPEERLRDFIYIYCDILFGGGEIVNDISTIFVAEMFRPSVFLDEMVEKHVRSQTEDFLAIIRDILGPGAPPEILRDCAASIVGQIIYYTFVWPLFSRVFPNHPGMAKYHEQLAEHVYRFSLGGLEVVKKNLEAGDHLPPSNDGK